MNTSNNTIQRYSDVDIFSTDGRIGQKRYFVFSIIIPFILFLAITPIAGLVSYLPIDNTSLVYSVLGIALLAMLLMTVRLTIQRCHDFNKSGALAILALIPFANIIFAVIPGTNGLNQYGEVPRPTTWLFKKTFYALIIAMVLMSTYIILQQTNLELIASFLSI